MTFTAQVIRVLIASPSDVTNERDAVEATMHRWNAENAEATGTVLMPVRWEVAATAESGDRPQAIINRQIVDSADILLGVFWTRLGTPTGVADSGSAEEIARSKEQGKPVALYFSTQPVAPESIDLEQLARVKKFKEREQGQGIIGEFSTPADLAPQVAAALTRITRERFGTGPQSTVTVQDAPRAHVSATTVAEPPGIRLTNDGAGEATAVSITTSEPDGDEGWHLLHGEQAVDFLAPGQSIDHRLMLHMGSPLRVNCFVRWINADGSEGSSRQTLQR